MKTTVQNSTYTVADFVEGEKVCYFPPHSNGKLMSDCENGIVSSKNSTFIFVKYIKFGILQETAAATNPLDLKKDHFTIE